MVCTGVDLDVMRDALSGQHLLELAAGAGREVALRVRADDRTRPIDTLQWPRAAAEEVDGERGIAGVGEASRDVFDVLVEAERLMDHDHSGMRSAVVGEREICAAPELARRDFTRLHRSVGARR